MTNDELKGRAKEILSSLPLSRKCKDELIIEIINLVREHSFDVEMNLIYEFEQKLTALTGKRIA